MSALSYAFSASAKSCEFRTFKPFANGVATATAAWLTRRNADRVFRSILLATTPHTSIGKSGRTARGVPVPADDELAVLACAQGTGTLASRGRSLEGSAESAWEEAGRAGMPAGDVGRGCVPVRGTEPLDGGAAWSWPSGCCRLDEPTNRFGII